MRKPAAPWVTRFLTSDQKRIRMNISKILVAQVNQDEIFIHHQNCRSNDLIYAVTKLRRMTIVTTITGETAKKGCIWKKRELIEIMQINRIRSWASSYLLFRIWPARRGFSSNEICAIVSSPAQSVALQRVMSWLNSIFQWVMQIVSPLPSHSWFSRIQ